jgi:hypothetical protein
MVLNNETIIDSGKNSTHLTSSLDVGVDSWMCWHGVAVEAGVGEFVEDWVVVAGNAGNLRQILTFFFLRLSFQSTFESRIFLEKKKA